MIVIAYDVYDLWSIQIASGATTTSPRYTFFHKVRPKLLARIFRQDTRIRN